MEELHYFQAILVGSSRGTLKAHVELPARGILRGDPGAGHLWQRGACGVGSSSTKWVAILGHRKFCESGKELLLFWACPEGMKLIE